MLFILRFSWIALDVTDSPVWTMCSAVVCISVCVCVCLQYSLLPAPYETLPRPSAQSPILQRQRLSLWILSRSWWRCTVSFADSRKICPREADRPRTQPIIRLNPASKSTTTNRIRTINTQQNTDLLLCTQPVGTRSGMPARSVRACA